MQRCVVPTEREPFVVSRKSTLIRCPKERKERQQCWWLVPWRFCSISEKNEKTLYKSRDTKRTKRKITVYLFLRGLQASTCFDRFFPYDGSYHDDKPLSSVLWKISSRCRKPCFFNHPLTVVVISKFPSAKNSSRRLGDTVTILKGQMLF